MIPPMQSMKYRRFGRTELQMPVFSCGGMRYQHSWKDVAQDEIPEDGQRNLEATIERAIAAGINHIETARGYGSSEMQLGRILPRFDRDKIIVQTKVAPQETGAKFLETFETSMALLQLDHVDLFSVHGINTAELLEQTLAPGGAVEVARQLQREGRVRFIGFSTHGSCADIVRAMDTGEFDYVNLHWYFVNDFNWPAVEEATRQDMGVFIISPNDKGGKLYAPPPKLVDLCAPLSPMIFNDLYCLARPQVHTLSLGVSRPSDFDEHLKALEFYDRADEISRPIDERLRAELDRVLGADWARGWWRGLPEHDDVPADVNLLEILRLWTFAKGLDLVEFGRMRYNLLGNAGHWFPGHNAADLDPASLAGVLKDSPFAERIPAILAEAHDLLFDKPVQRLSTAD